MKLDLGTVGKWELSLREAGYMSEEDHIIEHTKGDLWEMMSQTRGNFFFTNEKFIFTGGLLGVSNFAVKYSDIKELKLVNVGGLIPIIPTGIKVTCLNPENGKTVKHKCSVMKRKEWIEYLREKAGLRTLTSG